MVYIFIQVQLKVEIRVACSLFCFYLLVFLSTFESESETFCTIKMIRWIEAHKESKEEINSPCRYCAGIDLEDHTKRKRSIYKKMIINESLIHEHKNFIGYTLYLYLYFHFRLYASFCNNTNTHTHTYS